MYYDKSFRQETTSLYAISCTKTGWSSLNNTRVLDQVLARSLRENKVQIVVGDTWLFRERASGRNGRLNPLRMHITTEVGALFAKHPRRKNKALLLDISIDNHCAGSRLENAARHVGKHLADLVERKKTSTGLVPRYLLAPSSRYVDMWRGWLRRACPHQGARHQTGRAQARDTLQRVSTFGRRDESSTSSATIRFFFTVCTFITHASPTLQTGGGACEYPTARSQGPVFVHAHRTEEVTESEKREEANGVGSGIGVGGGNGDGNGVRGGNGEVDGDGDGNGAEAGAGGGVGAGTGTVVEVNERTQYLNGDWSGDGAGTGTGRERGRGREWRPVDEHRMGTGMGVATETRAVVEIETETRGGTRTGSGRAEERR